MSQLSVPAYKPKSGWASIIHAVKPAPYNPSNHQAAWSLMRCRSQTKSELQKRRTGGRKQAYDSVERHSESSGDKNVIISITQGSAASDWSLQSVTAVMNFNFLHSFVVRDWGGHAKINACIHMCTRSLSTLVTSADKGGSQTCELVSVKSEL